MQPEEKFLVARTPTEVTVTTPKGETQRISIADITDIIVLTDDTGPWGSDVWWMFANADTRHSIAYPQGASGEQALIDWMTKLPGFDHDAMTRAMSCTENATFPCWRKA